MASFVVTPPFVVTQAENWPFTAQIADAKGAVVLQAKPWSYSTEDHDPEDARNRNPEVMQAITVIVDAANRQGP